MSNITRKPPRLLPPHYLALSVLGMLGTFLLLEPAPVLAEPWRFVGLIPLVIGLVVAVKGSRQFAQAETNIIPFTESTALVTHGVFRYSRNPMYLGMILFLTGIALLLNHALPWLIVVAFALVIRFGFIRGEEELMLETFGDQYRTYQAVTARWLGFSGKRHNA